MAQIILNLEVVQHAVQGKQFFGSSGFGQRGWFRHTLCVLQDQTNHQSFPETVQGRATHQLGCLVKPTIRDKAFDLFD